MSARRAAASNAGEGRGGPGDQIGDGHTRRERPSHNVGSRCERSREGDRDGDRAEGDGLRAVGGNVEQLEIGIAVERPERRVAPALERDRGARRFTDLVAVTRLDGENEAHQPAALHRVVVGLDRDGHRRCPRGDDRRARERLVVDAGLAARGAVADSEPVGAAPGAADDERRRCRVDGGDVAALAEELRLHAGARDDRDLGRRRLGPGRARPDQGDQGDQGRGGPPAGHRVRPGPRAHGRTVGRRLRGGLARVVA